MHGQKAGPPTADELDQMRALVREAMEQGALGVASSLSGPPGSWIDTDTLVAMCEVASPYGGIYSTHMRTEGRGVFESVAEAIEIGRRAKVPVDIIHLKIAEHEMWGQMPELTATIAAARARGQDVQANVYPYRAGQNNLSSIIPPWAHEGGAQALIQRLKDPALRPRLENEINHGIPGTNWYNHYTATGGWEGMLLVSLSNPEYKRFEGKRMSEVIQALGKPGIDALFELLINNNGSVPTVYFHHSEDDMRYALKQPWVVDRLGRDGGDGGGSAGGGQSASAVFRNVSARARALRPRGEGDHDGGGDPQDDVGERGEDPPVRSRAAAPGHGGGRDGVQRGDDHRQRDLRKAAPVRDGGRVRDRQRQGGAGSRQAHRARGRGRFCTGRGSATSLPPT